ncbi:MAG: hypothetical protein WA990_14615 [Rubrobacteraceae bacterium]
MCVLCGEFVSQPHWTDRHVEDAARSRAVETGDYQRDRRRDRIHRASLANEVLRNYGLKVSDWDGSKYVLRDLKGRSELVQDLGGLWPAAARLCGRTLDPLDPALPGRISKKNRGG